MLELKSPVLGGKEGGSRTLNPPASPQGEQSELRMIHPPVLIRRGFRPDPLR